jgi:hypothetical protein
MPDVLVGEGGLESSLLATQMNKQTVISQNLATATATPAGGLLRSEFSSSWRPAFELAGFSDCTSGGAA